MCYLMLFLSIYFILIYIMLFSAKNFTTVANRRFFGFHLTYQQKSQVPCLTLRNSYQKQTETLHSAVILTKSQEWSPSPDDTCLWSEIFSCRTLVERLGNLDARERIEAAGLNPYIYMYCIHKKKNIYYIYDILYISKNIYINIYICI